MKEAVGGIRLQKILQMNKLAIDSFESSVEALYNSDFNLAENVIEKAKEHLSWKKKQLSPSKEQP